MKGPQDLGGMMGFGPVKPEQNEPVFHAPWERRVLGLTVAMGTAGAWTGDQSRHEREKLPPALCWSRSYYEIWFAALTRLLRERGMITGRDLVAERKVDPPVPAKRVLRAADVGAVFKRGFPYNRLEQSEARFAPGDRVRTGVFNTSGHTRLPAYARRKVGIITAIHGAHVYPDANGMGQGENPQWLYTVRFTAAEIWGKAASDTLCIDLFEPYLEAA
jgi:nitrile hydratase subunit beta